MIKKSLALNLVFIVLCVLSAHAEITIPGADGSDGALQVTSTTVIDLSEAITGDWNDNNSANAGKGIYDPQKWAVVFKYESVSIDSGSTVGFKNHPSRAPVVWLVNGNVTINGTVSLNGKTGNESVKNPEPGPGGFRGGSISYRSVNNSDAYGTQGAGFGPGGGSVHSDYLGTGGSYGTGGLSYGNQSLIPLIGGSGGGGTRRGTSGGAGGGAILIACQNTLTVNGIVQSNGGSGYNEGGYSSPGGSGGGIRLIAEILVGSGKINAIGGIGHYYDRHGGKGLIRIERIVNNNTLEVLPGASIVNLTSPTTATIWPPDNAPKVKILSIGGERTPEDPRASFGTYGADVALPDVSSTQVVVETTNVEQSSQIVVRVTPRFDANYTTKNATFESIVSEDPLVIRWVADLPVKVGYSALQVKVLRP